MRADSDSEFSGSFSHARAVAYAPRMDLAKLASTLPPCGGKLEKLLKRMILR